MSLCVFPDLEETMRYILFCVAVGLVSGVVSKITYFVKWLLLRTVINVTEQFVIKKCVKNGLIIGVKYTNGKFKLYWQTR
jgi:hypothetical protein